MKKMMMVLPIAVVIFACSSTRNTQSTASTDTDMTNTTAMTGDMTDTSGVLGTSAGVTTTTNANSSIYASGTATTNGSATVTEWNSRNNWKGDQTYVIEEPVVTTSYNAWTASPRSNWYNRYNTTGDDWMSVYYRDDEVLDANGMLNDTSALHGNWQLTMTPDLSTAWRNDNNDLGYVYANWNNGQPFVSGSATVNTNAEGSTNNSAVNVTTSTTNNMSGSSSSSMSSATWNNTNGASPNMYGANGNMYMMPKINLYMNNGSFTGFTGCNSISGRLNVSGDRLQFENSTPSTNIDCVAGFDQNVLLERLRRVDNYVVVNSQLQLRSGDQVLLTLNKGH